MKTLETKRLILRLWQDSDLEDLYEYASKEGVGENAGWPKHNSIEDSKEVLDMFISLKDVYAILYKENNKVIGSVGIHDRTKDEYSSKTQKEIGYVLSKSYWGQGLMSEAVKEVIKYCFNDLNIDILWCGHFDFNERSKRVVEKSGFKFYKTEIYEAKKLNKTFNSLRYILTKEDYYQNN